MTNKIFILLTILTTNFLTTNFSFAQTDYSKILQYYNKEKNFNGTVLVATNGKIDYLNGVGISNRQTQTRINAKTKFKVASITKTFTVVLILKLYEQGKLDLNTTIGKYLPEYKGQGKDKVTIHNLLTYSSGIPNCEGNTGIAVYQSPTSVDDFIDKYCSGNLEFEPGQQFSYDNGDYIILGRMYSTAEDLLKFDKGIFGYKLLNKETVDLMLTPYPELYGVAYGFWVTENIYGAQNIKVANRQGSIWGANANWLHLVDQNKTILVLSNTNATNLQDLTEQMVLISTGQRTTVQRIKK
jgi:CubicO group peptidase (beta-lactamase class C family)